METIHDARITSLTTAGTFRPASVSNGDHGPVATRRRGHHQLHPKAALMNATDKLHITERFTRREPDDHQPCHL
jgi:hypothetical protein